MLAIDVGAPVMSRQGKPPAHIQARSSVSLSVEGKSSGAQDDLAFALGLAVWWGLP
jgi:hypothetical protein